MTITARDRHPRVTDTLARGGAGALIALAGCSTHHAATEPVETGRDAGADAGPVAVDVLMQHNDLGRSGQNLLETVLTTSNVNASTFGRLFTLPVDGLIYAQPLIVTATKVAGQTRDVVIVATMHNSVYAFDATTGDALWHQNLGPSVPASEIGPVINDAGAHMGTVNTLVEVGILSTPVIDRAKGYIYVARADYTGQTMSVKVHVLDLATGLDESGSPVTVEAEAPGKSGTLKFDAVHESQRPGLLLLNGTVYVAFASYQDWFPFYGWILGYTYSGGVLSHTQTFVSSPGSSGAGFWNSGQGLVSDGTSVYALSSNAGGDTSPTDTPPTYGEAFLKLSPGLTVEDWFVPYNYDYMNDHDVDLGSGGPVLIPGTDPLLIAGGGKSGELYVVDTTNMGHLGADADAVRQEFRAVNECIYGAPVVWSGGGAPRLFIWGSGDLVKQYTLTGGLFGEAPSALGPPAVQTVFTPYEDPSAGVLSVSSNGSTMGTGIVWGVKPVRNPNQVTSPGMFYAFDALTLDQLWADVSYGDFAKFVPPTIANGKVYLATHSKSVIVYGLLAGSQ